VSALDASRRAREAEESSLKDKLREHEGALHRALADARSKSKALSGLMDARTAESERAAGLASRAQVCTFTKQRLSGIRLPVGRTWLTLRQSGERLPESRCFVENKRPPCQFFLRA